MFSMDLAWLTSPMSFVQRDTLLVEIKNRLQALVRVTVKPQTLLTSPRKQITVAAWVCHAKQQISLAVDCVRRGASPMQDCPFSLKMMLQAASVFRRIVAERLSPPAGAQQLGP
jgi:hypothetical protein